VQRGALGGLFKCHLAERILAYNSGAMFEGLLQPTHLIALVIAVVLIVFAFLIGRVLWRLGSKV